MKTRLSKAFIEKLLVAKESRPLVEFENMVKKERMKKKKEQ